MAKTKDRSKYQAVSLPIEFVEKVRDHVIKHPDKYRSIAEFVKVASMEQMVTDIYGHLPSKFNNINMTDDFIEKIACRIEEKLKKSKK